jgi:hypothetical protein
MNLLTAKVSPSGRRFLVVAGIILAVTGFAKLFTVTGDTTLLQVADPIFGVEFRYLMAAVGMLELIIAGLCFFSKNETLNTLMVAWLASGFLLYRIGIRALDWERPCGCLGSLTDIFQLSPQTADRIAIGLLGFLLVGSYGV